MCYSFYWYLPKIKSSPTGSTTDNCTLWKPPEFLILNRNMIKWAYKHKMLKQSQPPLQSVPGPLLLSAVSPCYSVDNKMFSSIQTLLLSIMPVPHPFIRVYFKSFCSFSISLCKVYVAFTIRWITIDSPVISPKKSVSLKWNNIQSIWKLSTVTAETKGREYSNKMSRLLCILQSKSKRRFDVFLTELSLLHVLGVTSKVHNTFDTLHQIKH